MLLFMDGMAHYDTTRIGMKYTAFSSPQSAWSVVAEGRFGNCLKRIATANNPGGYGGGYVDAAPLMTRLGAWTPATGGVCGFACKFDDPSLSAANQNGPDTGSLFAVLDAGNFVLKVIVNPTGTLSLIQSSYPLNNYGLLLATSAQGFTAGAWNYVECKWVINATTGLFQIRMNTVPILTYSGDTTSHNPSWTASGTWNTARFLNLASGPAGPPWLTVRMCDLYLADLASSNANDVSDFLGDGVIQTLMPDAVGSNTGWTSSAGPNWSMTNDLPQPDNDATYVRATTVGLKDTYGFQDVPVGTIIKGIQISAMAREETPGTATVAPIVHQGAADYVGPSQGVVSTAFDRYLKQPYDLNPATMVKFLDTEINADEFGFQKTY